MKPYLRERERERERERVSERFGKKVRDLKIPEGNGREGAGGGDCLNQSEALLHFVFTLQFGLYQTKH